MTKDEWRVYSKGFKAGDEVYVWYLWNWGSTKAKRERTHEGELDRIDGRGVQIRGVRISYKRIESISSLADAYEPDDAVLTPEGWVSL